MKRKKYVRFLGTVLVMMLLAGCGGGMNMSAEAPASSAPAAGAPEMAPTFDYADGESSFDMITSAPSSTETQSSTVYNDPNAKLIREANLDIQTTEFEQAVADLEEMVVGMGGYFQNAALQGGSYRNVNSNRMCDYIIRIPAGNYEMFMSQTGNLGYVTYRNETTQNIGEQYYDTEARLKTQKTKQERLLSLLEKAETMEDIISLENALSDVEYEIEQLSSTLNRYDSLVGFSTIYLTLNEVHKVTEETGVTNSLGQRMSNGLSSSIEGLVEGFQDLLVWVSYHIIGILVVAVIAAVAIPAVIRKVHKKKRKPETKSEG